MPRISIYVTDELEARMGQHSEANWSAVAQAAFTAEMDSRDRRRLGDRRELVAARLRATRGVTEGAGYARGRVWAEQEATEEELRRTAAFSVAEGVDQLDAPAYNLAEVLLADNDESTDGVREFVEQLFGREDPPKPFVEGFLRGASDVWEQVEELL